jgi:hypothetical protein
MYVGATLKVLKNLIQWYVTPHLPPSRIVLELREVMHHLVPFLP